MNRELIEGFFTYYSHNCKWIKNTLRCTKCRTNLYVDDENRFWLSPQPTRADCECCDGYIGIADGWHTEEEIDFEASLAWSEFIASLYEKISKSILPYDRFRKIARGE